MTSTVAGDSQAVTVSWQRPDGADYVNLVYIPDNGNLTNSDLTNLTDLSVTIGSLTRGKRYVFILSVHDMDGQSALLGQTSFTLSKSGASVVGSGLFSREYIGRGSNS